MDRVYRDDKVQKATKNFVNVVQNYDGLKGKVIRWTFEHGNTNHDPGILAWVLDPSGEELGRPGGKLQSASGFADWLAEMGRASFPLVDPADYRVLKAEAKAMASQKRLGTTLSALRKKASEESGDGLAEAKELLAKLLDFANYQMERAKALQATSPAEALVMYKRIGVMFKGDEVGKKADETLSALKKDKAFKRELKAGAIVSKMRELKGKIRSDRPLTSPGNRKTVAALEAMMAGLAKKYSDTKVFESAKKLMAGLGGH